MRSGLSQLELADQIGVARSTLTLWESGKRTPEFGSISAIAQLTQCDLPQLLSKLVQHPTDRDVLSVFHDLQPEQQQVWVHVGMLMSAKGKTAVSDRPDAHPVPRRNARRAIA